MTERRVTTFRLSWATVSVLLALCLHIGPLWFLLFGPLYGLPSVLELDLEIINFYRDRVFRESGVEPGMARPPEPLHVSVSVQINPEMGQRVSKPRTAEELARVRHVQRAIRSLWSSMSPAHTGYALVSMHIQGDGSIGEFVMNRISGDEEFQTFLLTFLETLKNTPEHHVESGEPMWIECEFVVNPRTGKGPS